MAKKIITLYIDDTSLRLMVTDGKRITEWAELPLEPGLIQNAAVIKEAEFVARVKQLFEAQKSKDRNIMVGVSGLRCLTRPMTLPQLPEAMLDEAVRREAERVLPVPLDQLYISWQKIPAPEGKTQVFLVAIPCKTADDLFKALHQAGLKPSFMSLKPLLLARVVKEKTAAIVDVQTADFDIVIMTDGVPQPVRSIAFAEETLPWPEKLAVIRNELDRTISFYNSNNPEKPLAPSVPIFASGALAHEPELCQSLSTELGHPVLPLPSPLEFPEGLDLSRYSVNIGLVLQSGKEAGAPAVTLNALPVPYQPKPISLINILALPAAVIAVGFLVFLVLLTQSISADIASTHLKLNDTQVSLQKKTAEKQKLTGKVTELEKKTTEVQTAHDSFTAALGSLEKQTARVNGDLEVTTGSLPNTVSLSSISHANSLLTISGQAPSARRVLTYILALDTSGRFGDIAITSMTGIEGEGMDFTLLPSLQPPSKWVSNLETAIDNYTGANTANMTGAVTWSSSNSSVATIRDTGLATSAAQGTTNITLTSGAISSTTILTVTEPGPGLVPLAVTPANPSITVGQTQQFTVIGGLTTTIRMTSITATNGILTIDGWTPVAGRVLSYLRGLEATGKFLEIHITRMTRTEDGGMNFSVVLKLGE